MRRRAPPLEATEAFLAAVRTGSFQAAAAEIALSPSAFSRRIQALEAFIGAPLFDRSGPVPRLTQAGRRFGGEVGPALETIQRAVASVRDSAAEGPLRVITSHSLALGWLMPRLAGLRSQLDLDVELTIGRDGRLLRSGEIDVAIWGGRDDAADHPRDTLAELDAVPATATQLADGRAPPRTIGELGDFPLLHARNAPNHWPDWLSRVGCERAPTSYRQFETTHFAYESAAAGLGVALASPMLADRLLKEMRLQPCSGARAPVDIRYCMIYAAPALRRRRDVARFRDWITDEVRKSKAMFDSWADGS